jgi:hypothetical protein
MPNFAERERAFEAKFAHDQEQRFKAKALLIRQLGLWAAGLLGKSGDDAASYAALLVVAEVEDGRDGVIRKLTSDLATIGVTSDQIQEKLEELWSQAGRML